MKHASLFSGIGGFDLAAQWMGWQNVFHCEINEFGRRVLKHYWPDSISYTDITKTDFTVHANTIDVISGGFPCQPYSAAGKRKGKEDPRHLWPSMLTTIRIIRPRWVVGENVFGLINWSGGVVFNEVQTDLEAEGYEVLPFILPACAVNAPHRRDRVWFIAHATGKRCGKAGADISGQKKWNCGNGNEWPSSNPAGRQCPEWINKDKQENSAEVEAGMVDRSAGFGNNGSSSNPNGQQLERFGGRSWNDSERWEYAGRQFTESSAYAWERWPTELPVCGRNDGIPTGLDGTGFSPAKWRVETIKAFGNAIVPQVALEIFKAIQTYETM